MKEYVPLPLVAEAKRLLEAEIRSAEGLNEPVFAEHFAKHISPKHFTLSEVNSRGRMGGGVGSTNNGLERKNRTYKDDISYKMEQATQALQTMFSWMHEQSLLDLKFDPKMPKGYSKPNPRTGFTKDKEVWSHKFFQQVQEELTRKDGLGVLELVWKFKDAYLMLSHHCRNSFLSKGTYFYCSIRIQT